MPVLFKLRRIEDLLAHAEMVPEVVYYMALIDEDEYEFKVFAGKMLWEGTLKTNQKEYKALMKVLKMKGIEFTDVFTVEEYVSRWR